MTNNTRRVLVLVGFLSICIISIFLVFNYFNSTQNTIVYFKNVHDITIYDITNNNNDLVSKIKKSGQTLRLNKSSSYNVGYVGNDGFESGNIGLDVSSGGEKTIDINPYYSKKNLGSILDKNIETIQGVLKNKYKNIYLYTLERGRLYHWGEWYATTLKYVGNDIDNSDTLRVVLHKEDNTWKVKTDPPSISLSKYIYPNIPHDILSDVNNFQQTPMLEKFTNPDTSHGPDGQ